MSALWNVYRPYFQFFFFVIYLLCSFLLCQSEMKCVTSRKVFFVVVALYFMDGVDYCVLLRIRSAVVHARN